MKDSRPWFTPMILIIGIATSILMVSCNTSPHHVSLTEPPEDKAKINLNTATKSELMRLPGIGETKAQQIIDSRPYHRVDELRRLFGFGEKTMASIRDKITVNPALDTEIGEATKSESFD